MNIIRKYVMMVMIIVGLQVSCNAAQGNNHIADVHQIVDSYPHLVEIFDILQQQGLYPQNFHNFVAERIIGGDDEDANSGDVIEAALNEIENITQQRFQIIIDDALFNPNFDFHQVQDPLFQYFMHHQSIATYNLAFGQYTGLPQSNFTIHSKI